MRYHPVLIHSYVAHDERRLLTAINDEPGYGLQVIGGSEPQADVTVASRNSFAENRAEDGRRWAVSGPSAIELLQNTLRTTNLEQDWRSDETNDLRVAGRERRQ